nr:uncharacterized protein LOC105859069 [Microcebus murinus]
MSGLGKSSPTGETKAQGPGLCPGVLPTGAESRALASGPWVTLSWRAHPGESRALTPSPSPGMPTCVTAGAPSPALHEPEETQSALEDLLSRDPTVTVLQMGKPRTLPDDCYRDTRLLHLWPPEEPGADPFSMASGRHQINQLDSLSAQHPGRL